MLAAKEWTKIDPKESKILALTACLSNLEKNFCPFYHIPYVVSKITNKTINDNIMS